MFRSPSQNFWFFLCNSDSFTPYVMLFCLTNCFKNLCYCMLKIHALSEIPTLDIQKTGGFAKLPKLSVFAQLCCCCCYPTGGLDRKVVLSSVGSILRSKVGTYPNIIWMTQLESIRCKQYWSYQAKIRGKCRASWKDFYVRKKWEVMTWKRKAGNLAWKRGVSGQKGGGGISVLSIATISSFKPAAIRMWNEIWMWMWEC